MKNIIFLVLVFSTFVHAGTGGVNRQIKVLEDGTFTTQIVEQKAMSDVDRDLQIKNCEAMSRFAESSFKARQNGVDASKMFNVVVKDSAQAKEAMESIIVDVFRRPLLTSKDAINLSAHEYANAFFIECVSP
ncbi:hypothetical protein [Acinetobacter sp. SA01]|uniref:hypothetical protein n=1 Tax=Acinetobacter sp. SA01 TaxID=1862567 RepID=UPI00140BD271|nr:hypothetical protein [Acinetobacter sp. SA01]